MAASDLSDRQIYRLSHWATSHGMGDPYPDNRESVQALIAICMGPKRGEVVNKRGRKVKE